MLNRGFSLSELLISLAIGGLVVSGSVQVVSSLTAKITTLNRTLMLESEMTSLMSLVQREIERSRFLNLNISNALSISDSHNAHWQISHHPNEPINSCVLYSYDKNLNGEIDNLSGNETFGLRLRSNAIEYRVSERLCDESGWHDLTSSQIIIVQLFRIQVLSRTPTQLQIELKISHAADTSISLHQQFFVEQLNAPSL